MSEREHVLEASGSWTDDGSSMASVFCGHPRCALWTKQGGYNADDWPGYSWDYSKPLAEIVSEAQASHDAWLASRV